MKKFSTLFAVLAIAMNMNAYDVVINEMCFDLNKETKTATMVQDPDYVYQYLGDIEIPSSIEVEGDLYTVTAIGEYCFFYTKGLYSVSIPETVEAIGTYAFCYSVIEKVNIPSKVKVLEPYVFSDCNDLVEITLSEGLEKICNGAFYACKLLENLTIPSTVTSIEGEFTFNLCTSLAELHVNMVNPVAFNNEIMFDQNIYDNTILYVPNGTKDAYKTTNYWCNFKNIEEDKVNTGIDNIVSDINANDMMYDLQGRRVFAPIKGQIYIQNGKKMIAK